MCLVKKLKKFIEKLTLEASLDKKLFKKPILFFVKEKCFNKFAILLVDLEYFPICYKGEFFFEILNCGYIRGFLENPG